MKYLQDYREAEQTALFEKLGTFFAFSGKQFDEQADPEKKYYSMGHGCFTPQGTEEELLDTLEKINEKAIAQDIADHGIAAIIRRELENHEAYYTRDISDTFDELQQYGITEDQIRLVFRNQNATDEQLKSIPV
jgi:hypothetical protein